VKIIRNFLRFGGVPIPLLILILGICSSATAQSDSGKNSEFGFFYCLPIEFPILDDRDFNTRITSLGFAESHYPRLNLGAGLQFHSNRLITTVSFNKQTKRENNQSQIIETEYRAFSINAGYDFLPNTNFSIYPYVGFKGCGLSYLYRQKAKDSLTFNTYLRDSFDYKEIYNSKGHLDLGLGLSIQRFYLINLRFGYLLPLETTRWYAVDSDAPLKNSPGIRYQFYFILNLGLGDMFNDRPMPGSNNRAT
jgi:hypothetical protein